jgi:hypothetical protein
MWWSCLLAASIAMLSGCERSSVEPQEVFDPVGSVSFSYRGARTGTFVASGEMQIQSASLPQFATGATAFKQDGLLNVFAFHGPTPNRGDFFALLLGEVSAPGSFPFDPVACAQQVFTQCRLGFFVPDLDRQEFDDQFDLSALSETAYVLVLGNIRITAHTPMRVRGTFQGIAFRGNEQTIQNLITVTSGKFDLPVRPQ